MKNYIIGEGIISQKDIDIIEYNKEYIDTYNKENYKKTEDLLSGLRVGMVLGSCGKSIDYKRNIKQEKISLLDVGYGNGSFLKNLEGLIEDRYGFDIVDTPLPLDIKRVDNITDRYYDIITFWDSLEHIRDLSFLKDLQCQWVVITVPYNHYFDNDLSISGEKWFKEYYKHLKPNEHLHHFNPFGLEKIMNFYGYNTILINSNLEDTVRKPQDPFYYQNTFTSVYYKFRNIL